MDNTICRNLQGEISPLEMLRPIKSDKILIDNRGDKWQQVTMLGYQRLADKYFWPADPTNSNNPLCQLPDTIENIKKQRNKEITS